MDEDTRTEWMAAVGLALSQELETLGQTWRANGNQMLGPGTLAIRLETNHDGGPRHVDVGFCLNRDNPSAPIIWDCVSGGTGSSLDDAARLAGRLWGQTTAPTILELLTQRGEYAEHANDETLGLAGWHSIHGPILAYGRDDSSALQTWCLDHPVVPLLRESLVLALERKPAAVHGVKLLMGAFDEDSIAEVRIDGVRHDACSDALLSLPWPRTGTRVVRSFVIFVHPL